MRSFNCLSADCPIFGPHLLEASAGTGKTFSIEHVFVRLLLESEEIDLEQILAVTFTRAATRDLKKRIRGNLEEASNRIRSKKQGWEYLEAYLGSEKAARKLEDAVMAFDRCQIFTIHGFCHRMLQEFAFEAHLGFSLTDPNGENLIPKRIYRAARNFIETGIGPDLVCPEQMAALLKECDTIDELIRRLLKKTGDEASRPLSVLLEQFAFDPVDESELLAAFRRIQPEYKATVKGNFEAQVRALARGDFRSLLKEGGSLFAFLKPTNRKVKATLACPPLFERAAQILVPLIEEAMDPKKILGCLREAWKRIGDPILSEEQWFDPDEILNRMRMASELKPFVACVRKKYRAVIVDEFQDTDPLQWEIFKILFLSNPDHLKAFYLVGDPKQSIYRFRKADIYTYFEARTLLGSSALYCLDTNYRSSVPMIKALNALFDRNWLSLPKLGQTIPCPSVKSRSEISSDFSDVKGAVHFMTGHDFEQAWLPYAVLEIERLLPLLKSPSSFAILVKDRYQAETALRLLQERSIPAIAKSHTPLGKTLAFQAVRELVEALESTRDNSMRRIVSAGPFGSLSLSASRTMLEEQGLIPFCRLLANCGSEDPEFQQDLKQVIEELLEWEGSNGFSFQGLLRFLSDFEQLDPEEGGRRRVETDAEAVQILTLHVSKGLEFDIVFALGLTARPPEAEEAEEADAEKLRQLYVAMTRAKRRLYVPISSVEKTRGSISPMELFCQTLEAQEGALLPFLEKTESVTCETLPERIDLPPSSYRPKDQEFLPPSPLIPAPFYSYLHSFTSLAQPKSQESVQEPIRNEESAETFTSHTIPRGTETGILIHEIFEKLFSAPTPIWKDAQKMETLVAEHLQGTPLVAWDKAIQEMIWNTLHLKIGSFSLIDLEPSQIHVEMEFLFSRPPHFVKGFIDLVFIHQGKLYFLDWKTNWLGPDDSAYCSLNEAMTAHDYWLQAKLYAEALRRHVKLFYIQPFDELFGGAIYLFLRGGGICHFQPDLTHE